MSEYQYYEFQAIDCPLTESQMAELRRYSSRAAITPTSFVNEYNWGNFKGNPRQWMEKYFDAFLYVTNWGSHWLELRVPKRLLDPETVSTYCIEESLSCRAKGNFAIISFASEDESGEWAAGEGWLASMTPLRADLMNGDLRSLYLGWLVAAQESHLEDDELEPPVPPGLGALNAPLRTLVDFLRIDPDWIAAAAEESAEMHVAVPMPSEIADWAAKMPSKEKDAVIAALIEGSDSHFAVEFRQRAVREIRNARNPGGDFLEGKRRSAGQLAARAKAITEDRKTRETEARARAKAKREREQAEARKKRLESLSGKEDGLWSKVDALIASKQPKRYDEAVSLLQDLRDLAAMTDQDGAFATRMEALIRKHARKPSLLERFRKANLMGPRDPA